MIRTNWRETVKEIEEGLSSSLKSIDQYEKKYAEAFLQDHNTTPSPIDALADQLPKRPDGFAEHLAISNERANAIEQLLNEQEAVWKEFQLSIHDLQNSLKKQSMNLANLKSQAG